MGLWFGALVPFHPNILKGHIAEDILGDGMWTLTHAAMFLVGVAGVFAAAGLVAVHNGRLGQRGSVALVATVVASFATAAAGAVEATALPLLAKQSADLVTFDGPMFGAPLFRAITGPWLFLPLCLAGFGWLAFREGTYRNAGAALAVGGATFFALGMWFVPVVGVLSCVALGAALLWWAAILWRATDAAGPSR